MGPSNEKIEELFTMTYLRIVGDCNKAVYIKRTSEWRTPESNPRQTKSKLIGIFRPIN